MQYDPSKEKDREVLQEYVRHLHTQLIEEKKRNLQLTEEKKHSEEINEKLSEELKNLRAMVFASKQERVKETPKLKRSKGNLPHNQSDNNIELKKEINLEEEVQFYPLAECLCPKCGSDNLKEINSFEESSEVDVIPAKYIIRRHKRHKYSCQDCSKIITAPGGVKLTSGGQYSIQMATQIAVDKFEFHIPLERQRKQMENVGLNVDVKTLYGLTEHLYNRLFPLGEMIRQDALSNPWLHIDESPINFYNPNKSKGYVWSMSNSRGAYYQFEPTRSGAVAEEMLRGYESGVVVTDGFSGYNFLDRKENLKHAYCWAHVRRKFFEANAHDRRAKVVVDLIDDLYKIEHEAETLEGLKVLRSDKSSVIVSRIDSWIESMESKFLNSTTMGKAIYYYTERRKGLHLFLLDENVLIDNNQAERKQRCPVMGRKNFLHFKSINGADVATFFYSLVESCKSNGLNASAYIFEMGNRAAKGKELESPYLYSKRLIEEITIKLSSELEALVPKSEGPSSS